MRVTILGCGSSSGTPSVDRGWGKCDPINPRNRRLRASILVEDKDTTLLVDTSPDLRQQLLDADVTHLDAVLYTHTHADHLHGIDDLRGINRRRGAPIDVYANSETLSFIAERFGYVFRPLAADSTFYYKPTLVAHEIQAGGSITLKTIEASVFEQDHGYSTTLGFRFGSVAYSTDVVALPEEAFAMLHGVETWIIGTLMEKPHPTHAHVDKALEWIERVQPKRAVLTHLSDALDYDELAARLPEGVVPAYDGMIIETPS